MAGKLGHEVQSISYEVSPAGYSKTYHAAREIINEATAFFVPTLTVIAHLTIIDQPNLASLIQDRVRDGARLFVQPWNGNDHIIEKWNGFLARYDLTVTTLKICEREGNSIDCGPSERLVIRRNAHSFREPMLFQGVEQVVLEQPVAIHYGGESLPVLCATDAELPIDRTTDLLPIPESRWKGWMDGDPLPPEWNARELACMAVWHGNNGGAVMPSIGPALYDRGRMIEENAQLAANI